MLTQEKISTIPTCTTCSPHRVEPGQTQPSRWAIDHARYCWGCASAIEHVVLEEQAGECAKTLKEDIWSLIGEGVHVMFRKGFPSEGWAHEAWCGINDLPNKEWSETLQFYVAEPVMSVVGAVVGSQRRIIRDLRRQLREAQRELHKLRQKER
jgi:hypothetical protein